MAKALHHIADRGDDLAAVLDVGKFYKNSMRDLTVLAKLAKTLTKVTQYPTSWTLSHPKRKASKTRLEQMLLGKH